MPSEIILYKDKKNCCGCGACMNICPKNAISMREDKSGFIYPDIDRDLCIKCGKCMKVCAFQNTEIKNNPIKTFAAVGKNPKVNNHSASGGIFASLARQFIKKGGIVFGASFDNNWNVNHIKADNISLLKKLQGSKYVQSSTGTTFSEVKKLLENGEKIFYSGTPCQIAGLYGFLGKNYENLVTADLICHGVPNNRMFREYINSIEKKENGKVIKFSFRDKSIGWGINGSAVIEKNNSRFKKKLWQSASPYLYYFSQGCIYRDCCYECKYACEHRPADITLGDYWGIEKAHPEYLGKNNWDEKKGISVVIANTEKGLNFINSFKNCADFRKSDFQSASEKNSQLRKPSSSGKRNEILKIYTSDGWNALEKRFNKNIGFRKYSSFVKTLVPQKVKRILKAKKTKAG